VNTVAPHKKQLPSSIPNFDTLEGFTTEGDDDYSTFKKLQRQLECVFGPARSSGHRWLTGADTSTFRKSTSRMSNGASSASWSGHRRRSREFRVYRSSLGSLWRPSIRSTSSLT
jgi:hypothetical protein